MRRFRFIPILLVALAIAGCDGGPSESGGSNLHFDLVQAAFGTAAEPYIVSTIRDCFVTSGGGSLRLEGASASLNDIDEYSATIIAKAFPYDVSVPDTFTLAGTFLRRGSLVTIDLGQSRSWYGSLGPDASDPSTLILSDFTRGGAAPIFESPRCRELEFVRTGRAPIRRIRGGVGAASVSLRRIYGDATLSIPYTYGRLANNRYDSARVELSSDGSYRFRLWHMVGNSFVRDDTSHVVSEVTGQYVQESSWIAFDPETARTSFAIVEADSFVVLRNSWDLPIGRDADLLFLPK